jgi:hypothetical protein
LRLLLLLLFCCHPAGICFAFGFCLLPFAFAFAFAVALALALALALDLSVLAVILSEARSAESKDPEALPQPPAASIFLPLRLVLEAKRRCPPYSSSSHSGPEQSRTGKNPCAVVCPPHSQKTVFRPKLLTPL